MFLWKLLENSVILYQMFELLKYTNSSYVDDSFFICFV